MSRQVFGKYFVGRGRYALYGVPLTFAGIYSILTSHCMKCRETEEFPPARRTMPYVTGSGRVGERKKYLTVQKITHVAYATYRTALLVAIIIPLCWYGVLTSLKWCSETFFYWKVLEFLTSMGPTYIKLGQWMATRPDIFPPGLCATLEKLYADAPTHSWSYTQKVLQSTVASGPSCEGKKTIDFLVDIEEDPISSGSIAQVHRAVLGTDLDGIPKGTKLAIKVPHPRVSQMMAADITSMKAIVSIINFLVPDARLFNLKTSLCEFDMLVSSQLNFLVECDNLEQFKFNFRKTPGIIFPTPLPSLCTEELLAETFERGTSITSVNCSSSNSDIAELGCHMFMKMLFDDNFVHSDLHPGNILLRENNLSSSTERYPDGKVRLRRELVILDAGLVTSLSRRERENFISLFAAVACGEGELGAELMIERFSDLDTTWKKNIDSTRFREDIKKVFAAVAPEKDGFKLSKVKMGDVLGQIVTTIRESKAPLDGNFSSLVLTVMVGEGLGRKLTPDFNIFSEAAPFLISFLDDSELSFLGQKLRETYGVLNVCDKNLFCCCVSKVFRNMMS